MVTSHRCYWGFVILRHLEAALCCSYSTNYQHTLLSSLEISGLSSACVFGTKGTLSLRTLLRPFLFKKSLWKGEKTFLGISLQNGLLSTVFWILKNSFWFRFGPGCTHFQSIQFFLCSILPNVHTTTYTPLCIIENSARNLVRF